MELEMEAFSVLIFLLNSFVSQDYCRAGGTQQN